MINENLRNYYLDNVKNFSIKYDGKGTYQASPVDYPEIIEYGHSKDEATIKAKNTLKNHPPFLRKVEFF